MELVKNTAGSTAGYLIAFLALVLAPFGVLARLYSGLCLFLAALAFLFWLIVSHHTAALHATVVLLLWGLPGFFILGLLTWQAPAQTIGMRAPK
jgi:hypothetical protein